VGHVDLKPLVSEITIVVDAILDVVRLVEYSPAKKELMCEYTQCGC
jgi:hypothetical protein